MSRDELNQAVTGYGFMAPVYDGQSLDLFVPEELARPIQIRPGATFLWQREPDIDDQPGAFNLRSRTGLEAETESVAQFTATLRFSNTPGRLGAFLRTAANKKIIFRSMRTFGYRGSQYSDLVFEGNIETLALPVNDFRPKNTPEDLLRSVATQCGATLMRFEPLSFEEYGEGQVFSSLFHLDVPIVGGRFFRLRLEKTNSDRLGSPSMKITRLVADYGTGLMQVDTSFAFLSHYLLEIECPELEAAPPVTEKILRVMDHGINVDAISGSEFVAFVRAGDSPPQDREITLGSSAPKPQIRGRIEILCTSGSPLVEPEIERKLEDLQAEILEKHGTKIQPEFISLHNALDRARNLRAHLSKAHQAGGTEKNGMSGGQDASDYFHVSLSEGRYIYVDKLGDGAFGVVNRYLDLRTCKMVAGKRFHNQKVRMTEIEALERATKTIATISVNKHLVGLLDTFFDGGEPVLITECLDFCLEPRRSYNDGSVDSQSPDDLRSFLDMGIQLLKGLASLHSLDEDAKHYVHRDIKPSNIGGIVETTRGKQTITWKLMDFGLAKGFEDGQPDYPAEHAAGSLPYMSPQAIQNRIYRSNDIYSLGIVLFQVLHNWEHPSRNKAGALHFGHTFPVEVIDQVHLEEPGEAMENLEPISFDPSRWSPDPRFAAAPEVMEQLRQIIYRMLALDRESRYLNAGAALRELQSLATRFDASGS